MGEPVPQLNYARPTDPRGPLRKKAVSHCLGNGIGGILLGMLTLLEGALWLVDGSRTSVVVIGWILVGYALVFVASGAIYMMASFKIRQPNRVWERIVVITGVIHVGCIVLAIVALGIMLPSLRSARIDPGVFLPQVVSFLMLLTVLQGVQYVRKAGRETWGRGVRGEE